jgi:hypothetical protein
LQNGVENNKIKLLGFDGFTVIPIKTAGILRDTKL